MGVAEKRRNREREDVGEAAGGRRSGRAEGRRALIALLAPKRTPDGISIPR
jgi:hypothetical protein